MLIVGGESEQPQRSISRTKTRQVEKSNKQTQTEYTQIEKTKIHTHSNVPANRRNKSNLK